MSRHISASGTLVVAIPCDEGLVIAADSRMTIGDRYYDISDKISITTYPPNTAVTVTGTPGFIEEPPPDTPDLEQYYRTAPRLLDIQQITVDYLQGLPDQASDIDMLALGQKCKNELELYLQTQEHDVPTDFGVELCTVIVVSFDPANRTSRICQLKICTNKGLRLQLFELTPHEFDPTSPRDFLVFGDSAYFYSAVCSSVGRKFLNPETAAFISNANRYVQDIPLPLAIRVSNNMIEAAQRTSVLVPPSAGIGGPIGCCIIGNRGVEKI